MALCGLDSLLTTCDESLPMRGKCMFGMQGVCASCCNAMTPKTTRCDTNNIESTLTLKAILKSMHVVCVPGSGGGAGWTGASGGLTGAGTSDSKAGAAGAGTSFLASSVTGTCTGLPGNDGNGYVAVALP